MQPVSQRNLRGPATVRESGPRSNSLIVRSVVVCLLVVILSGCAGIEKMPQPTSAPITGVSETFHRNQILDLTSGKVVSFDEFTDRISTFDVIFVGEVHTNAEHHLIQVQILQALLERVPDLMIGVEFLQQDQQAPLDGYIIKDTAEKVFLEQVDWKRTWGYPYHFYRPLMLAAKRERTPVFALNAPRDIVRKVARKGLAGLEERERAVLPVEMNLTDEAHRSYVRAIYEHHDHRDLEAFEFFYEAQVVRDETMASNIAESIRKQCRKMVVFSGNGHIVRKFGIPDRTLRRVPVSLVTVMPYALKDPLSLDEHPADYLWFTSP